MNEPKDQATGTPCACHCSAVSLIDFQMTVANLSVAEHALREEPYDRLPYLAGTMQVAQAQMESLRQEAIELKSAIWKMLELTNPLMQCDERELHRARQQAERLVGRNP